MFSTSYLTRSPRISTRGDSSSRQRAIDRYTPQEIERRTLIKSFVEEHLYGIQDVTLRTLIIELSKIYGLPITDFPREEGRNKDLMYCFIGKFWSFLSPLIKRTVFYKSKGSSSPNIDYIINSNAYDWVNRIREEGESQNLLSDIMSHFSGYITAGTITYYNEIVVIVLMTHKGSKPVHVCTIKGVGDRVYYAKPKEAFIEVSQRIVSSEMNDYPPQEPILSENDDFYYYEY